MTLRPRLFRIISRTCIAAYRMLPLFGALRGAIAVVRRNDRYVMVRRADALGLCFPGGLAHPWESLETTLRREIEEETGLAVQHIQPWFEYRDNQLYPTQISVFHAETDGEIRSSWEGDAVIVDLAEMEANIIVSQREVVSRLKGLSKQ